MARAQCHTAERCGFDSRPLHDMDEQNQELLIPSNELDDALSDIITSRPTEIRIGRKTLRLYPVTLAKSFLLRRCFQKLDVNDSLLKGNPYVECLRLAERKPDVVARILAIHSAPNNEKALHDNRSMEMRRNLLQTVKTEHLAGLLMSVLAADKTEMLIEHLGIKAERERLAEVLELRRRRSTANTLVYGGKSIFGTFIGQLKEMGYSDREILFERSYSYLRLMLADKVTSVYLSDEELEQLPQSAGGTLLDGDSDGDLDALAALIKTGGEMKTK